MAEKKATQYELFDLRSDLEVFEEIAGDFRKVRNAIASWHAAMDDVENHPGAIRFGKVLRQAQELLEVELAEGPGAADGAAETIAGSDESEAA